MHCRIEQQSRFGDKSLNFQVGCPQNWSKETAVLKGLGALTSHRGDAIVFQRSLLVKIDHVCIFRKALLSLSTRYFPEQSPSFGYCCTDSPSQSNHRALEKR